MQHVDMPAAVGAELAPPRAGPERDEQDQGPITLFDGMGQLEYGLGVHEGPLRASLDARACDVARVDGKDAIAHRGVQDGPQQPVCLGRLQWRRTVGHVAMPLAHVARLDTGQLGRSERGEQMAAEQIGVQVGGAPAERAAVGPAPRHPLGGVDIEALR